MKDTLEPAIVHDFINEIREKYKFTPEDFIGYAIEHMYRDEGKVFTIKDFKQIVSLVIQLEKDY